MVFAINIQVQTRWLLRFGFFLPLGKLEMEATWFSQVDYQKKREEENRVPDALFLVCQGSFVQIKPLLNEGKLADLSALKGEG